MNNEFNPLVSIVIPVYNGSNFLSEAIEEYTNCELLERLNKGVAEIRAGEGIEWRSW